MLSFVALIPRNLCCSLCLLSSPVFLARLLAPLASCFLCQFSLLASNLLPLCALLARCPCAPSLQASFLAFLLSSTSSLMLPLLAVIASVLCLLFGHVFFLACYACASFSLRDFFACFLCASSRLLSLLALLASLLCLLVLLAIFATRLCLRSLRIFLGCFALPVYSSDCFACSLCTPL